MQETHVAAVFWPASNRFVIHTQAERPVATSALLAATCFVVTCYPLPMPWDHIYRSNLKNHRIFKPLLLVIRRVLC
ncbi:MAG: hypothetical protein AMJ93_15335 [Anaerolineae bacterium SM23_84]|nr:MAG: hypothetical protein AMJ93_15335 [Anaerolineae bacterium SM23_84]